MQNAKISRRSFLLGLAACSAAGVLTACKGTDAPSGSTASSAPEPPASSAAASTVQQPEPFLTVEEFPPLDGSTACIPLMAQMLADTTGMDLEEARSSITVSTTAYAWENFGLYDTTTRMLAAEIAADPGKVDAALDVLMVIKYLERIGDHAVNIAEWVEFLRTGRYHHEKMF